jgi:hypothetical protein
MSLKAWTAGVIIPLAAAFTVSTSPTASAVGTATAVAPQATVGVSNPGVRPGVRNPVFRNPGVRNPVFHNPVVRRPIFHNPVVRRPIFHNPVVRRPIFHNPIVRRPIFHNPIFRPIFRNRLIVRPIVLVDPFVQCAAFFDEDGQPVFGDDDEGILDDPLFVSCADFFGFDPNE